MKRMKVQELSSVGLERVRLGRKTTFVQRYLKEKVFYGGGGVLWQRGFILTRLQKDGQPDIILACIDDFHAREKAAGRDPLAQAIFDATVLPPRDRVVLYDAMGAGDTKTMDRLMRSV